MQSNLAEANQGSLTRDLRRAAIQLKSERAHDGGDVHSTVNSLLINQFTPALFNGVYAGSDLMAEYIARSLCSMGSKSKHANSGQRPRGTGTQRYGICVKT
jgi:hypothetical protein